MLVRHDNGRAKKGDQAEEVDAVENINVRDMEDGTYEVTYVANVAGVYELSVLCRESHVADSPYPVRVLPGPAVFVRTLVSGVKMSIAPGDTLEFDIHARDRFGNRCTSDPDVNGPLEVLLDGSADGIRVVRAGDGRMVARVVIEDRGRHVLSVLLGGRDVPGTPFSIECEDGASSVRGSEEEEGGGDEGGDNDKDEGGTFSFLSTTKKKGKAIGVERSKWDAFVFDEDDEQWDDDDDDDESHGDDDGGTAGSVPVVETLEDLWLVSKLQQERKAREAQEKKKRVEAMKRDLEARFGSVEVGEIEDERAAFHAFLGAMVGGGGDRGVDNNNDEGDDENAVAGVSPATRSRRNLARRNLARTALALDDAL